MWRYALVVVVAGCGADGYHPSIDPARFSATIDNPYFPLEVGTVYVYEVTESGEQVEVTVTDETREVMGVTCRVVHDVASIEGTVVEDTYDWYAQDDDGTVWYFGEDTTEFDGPDSTTEGSWES